MKYKIRTNIGYYVAVEKGRPQRYGSNIEAAVFCENHVNAQLAYLWRTKPEYEPAWEAFRDNARCVVCEMR